jgi:hypothetical protein
MMPSIAVMTPSRSAKVYFVIHAVAWTLADLASMRR